MADAPALFELTPAAGERPSDLGSSAAGIAAVVSQTRRGTISVHRFCENGQIRTVVALRRTPNPAMLAEQIARAVGAKTQPLVGWAPELPSYAVGAGAIHAQGAPSEVEIGAMADWLSASLARSTDTMLSIHMRRIPRLLRHAVHVGRQNERVSLAQVAMSGDQYRYMSTQANAVVARPVVWSAMPEQGQSMLGALWSYLPRFSYLANPRRITSRRPAIILSAVALLLLVLLGVTGRLMSLLPLSALGVIVLLMAGWWAQADLSMRLMSKHFLSLPIRTWWPLLYWRAHTGPEHAVRRGQIILDPPQIAPLFMPPGHLAATPGTTASVQTRNAPVAVYSQTGVRLGRDPEGHPIRVGDRDRYAGIFCAGSPGTGKSTMLLHVWGGDLCAKHFGFGPENSTPLRGGRTSLIWIESKGEGADRAEKMATRVGAGSRCIRFRMGAPDGPRLEMLDRGNPTASAAALASAARYAFEPRAIGPSSMDALISAFAIGLSLPPEILQQWGLNGSPNIIRLAQILMGGDKGTNAQKQLLDALYQHVGRPSTNNVLAERLSPKEDSLAQHLQRWQYYMGRKPSDQEAIFAPPLNKLEQIGLARFMWEGDDSRPTFSLAQILNTHMSVIIDFGALNLPEVIKQYLSSIFTYMLWESIKAHCQHWESQGRSVVVFADELANIAGKGSEGDVVRDMYDHGREHGLQLVLATQRWGQLLDKTAEVARSMSTKVYLTQESADVAREAVIDLVGTDYANYGFSERDVRDLPRYHGLMRTRVNGQAQPPFTIMIEPDDSWTW